MVSACEKLDGNWRTAKRLQVVPFSVQCAVFVPARSLNRDSIAHVSMAGGAASLQFDTMYNDLISSSTWAYANVELNMLGPQLKIKSPRKRVCVEGPGKIHFFCDSQWTGYPPQRWI